MSDNVPIIGNLTDDPVLRFTNNGTAVANFTLAVNRKDRNGEEEAHFFDVTCWKDLAENVAESLHQGDRVIAVGQLKQEKWEQDGQKRSKVVLTAWDVGPTLKWARAEVTKTSGSSVQQTRSSAPPPPSDDDVPF